ncbi:NAD(P)-dependent oxidoreductase [Virgibacillus sp. W0181]|uniref:NAD(P)-dependent oxidoreductase n=1 Tax=Virgibacillus sp. W0181 TaxID=3391581 RepID=UPI003F470D9F
MVLLTIDELQDEKVKEIESITGKEVHLLRGEKDILYEAIEIMITYGIDEDWELIDFDKLPNLKWIQVFQTGIEQVPIQEIEERNIRLTNVRNIYGSPMSEYVMSIILYELRDLARFIQNKKNKKYDRTKLVDEAGYKTIGIFGTGDLGVEVAKKAKAFDMNVLGFNSNGRPVEYFDQTFTWEQKEEMIQQCDFIVLLLPLVDRTYHFLTEKEFNMMKDNAYVINVGRGPLVKEEALLEALENNVIKGAAVDVFYEEPLPESSPLWEANNLILTPHLSAKTTHFFDRSIAIFRENYQSFKRNEALKFEIDFIKGY